MQYTVHTVYLLHVTATHVVSFREVRCKRYSEILRKWPKHTVCSILSYTYVSLFVFISSLIAQLKH
jgi:hypothetical protein